MKNQFCPQCDEDNPLEAVMCWACYSPLKGVKPAPAWRADGTLNTEPTLSKSWRRKAEGAVPLLLIFGLISSGWWRGKTRFGVLGVSSGIVALIFAIQEWNERKNRLLQSEMSEEASPICRIADTILLYGIKDEATAIRILCFGRGIKVEYQIDGEWREQMKIPLHVWVPLQKELLLRAQSGGVGVSSHEICRLKIPRPTAQKAGFSLRISTETQIPEILLTRIEAENNVEKTPLELKQCPHCREDNLSDAMLCATCYAPLKGAQTFAISLKGRKINVHFPQVTSSWLRGKTGVAAFVLALGTLVSSGWWRGKTRFIVLGAGSGITAWLFAMGTSESRKQERFRLDPRPPGNAITALADSMLLDASEQNATQMRISRRANEVTIGLLIGEEWLENAAFPLELLKPLENEFILRAQNGDIAVSPNYPAGIEKRERDFEKSEVQNARFSLRILIEPPHEEILLTRI